MSSGKAVLPAVENCEVSMKAWP